MSDNCIFCKIVRGEIPSKKVYEDDEVLAFHDINPVAPVHFMLVPKLHLDSLLDAEEVHAALLGKMLLLAPKLAREQGLDGWFPHRDQHRQGRRAGSVSFAYSCHRRRQYPADGQT